MIVAAIVAVAQNGVIGHQNRLPWHQPADLKHFKQLTTQHTVLMGRNTYLSIGKPLPNRINIVVSSQPDFSPEGCYVVKTISEGIKLAQNLQANYLFVIGGGQVYQAAMPYLKELYLTEIQAAIIGDTYFEFNKTDWKEVSRKSYEPDEKNPLPMDFVCYHRVSSL